MAEKPFTVKPQK